jgi:hypothetical protein
MPTTCRKDNNRQKQVGNMACRDSMRCVRHRYLAGLQANEGEQQAHAHNLQARFQKHRVLQSEVRACPQQHRAALAILLD